MVMRMGKVHTQDRGHDGQAGVRLGTVWLADTQHAQGREADRLVGHLVVVVVFSIVKWPGGEDVGQGGGRVIAGMASREIQAVHCWSSRPTDLMEPFETWMDLEDF